MTDVRHPAKFNDDILWVAACWLRSDDAPRCPLGGDLEVLDPFAGTGRVHGLHTMVPWCYTSGIELEPEWAAMHPLTLVGDALHLPWPDDHFDVIFTSPCYGNRMADHQEPTEKCRACKGTGFKDGEFKEYPIIGLDMGKECPKCKGKGHNKYRRNTYRHALGRRLSEGSAAGLQWGPAYKLFHLQAWREAVRVLRPSGWFILNCKDHVRKGFVQHVTDWHIETLTDLGLQVERHVKVAAKGLRQGDNHDVRVDHEDIVLLVKK